MSFWDSVKNKGLKTKLQGEIVLLNREIAARQRTMGIALYDCLEHSGGNSPFPEAFHTTETNLKEPLQDCQNDVHRLREDKLALDGELDHLQAKQDRTPYATTTSERLSQWGTAAKDTATEAKLKTQMAYLDRQIKQRKEAFGLQVYAMATQNVSSGGGVKNRLQKMRSGGEPTLTEILQEAKADVDILEAKKAEKEREIQSLDEPM